MNYGLKVLLKEPFNYLKSRFGRQFLKYCFQLGNKTRFKKIIISLGDKNLELVDTMSFLWQYHDIYFKGVYEFQTENKKPLIIDCGANIGLSVIYLKKLHPGARLICFEADPDIGKILQGNVSHLDNVEVINKAVWTHDEGICLNRNGADGAHISDEGEDLPSIRLRTFLENCGHVDLLKLDIEGAEFDVIKDCADVLSKIERLFVEVHTFEGESQRFAELLDVIEKAGFRYFIENANFQQHALNGKWKANEVEMDLQLNVYCVRE